MKSELRAKGEFKMWDVFKNKNNNENIGPLFDGKGGTKRELMIVTETGREYLPNLINTIKTRFILEDNEDGVKFSLRPSYQRRPRWENDRKSKLIESLILNIPVPPCFLYEADYARYEVMDGQQRMSSIFDFYKDAFALCDLEILGDLNGKTYSQLPMEERRKLDRRTLSYIVILKESVRSAAEESILRAEVFSRLNTGAVKLERQEVRNCIFSSEFNNSLIKLAEETALPRLWYTRKNGEGFNSEVAKGTDFYKKMQDAEFVLRFFALRHVTEYKVGMQAFLDSYMIAAKAFSKDDILFLENLFKLTINLVEAVYGEFSFRPWLPAKSAWDSTPRLAYADAQMIAMCDYVNESEKVIFARDRIVEATKQMVASNENGIFTGRANTKSSVLKRIDLFKACIKSAIG